MRDTSDMMSEDSLSEDTMMDCEGDAGGLDELVDLATDVADSSPTIRDAAERLLTLLGVDEEGDEESLVSSSSEDEGVELDGEEDEEAEREGGRLLHQLAATLANELKQCRERQRAATTTDPVVAADHTCLRSKGGASDCRDAASPFKRERRRDGDGECAAAASGKRQRRRPPRRPDARSRIGQEGGVERTGQVLASSWNAGWDACATEAVRYLMEDEGLPPHHPTVLAMKDHLEVQRERAFLRYAA